jgi:uncharacterized RDD family membrane protein YckC
MGAEPNPYEAPGTDLSARDASMGVARDAHGRFILAGRGARFAGAVIDQVFYLFILLCIGAVTAMLLHGEPLVSGKLFERSPEMRAPIMMGCAVLVPAIQAWLITQRGQSIGKIIMRTRIVRADGRIPGFYHGVILRTLPVAGLGLISVAIFAFQLTGGLEAIGTMVRLVLLFDALLLFMDSHQCGHDRLAGTYVARATSAQRGQ